jgi:hypothetical protein
MDAQQPPAIPPKPDFEAKPPGSWLYIVLVLLTGLAAVVILTFLTLGFFGPFVVLGVAIFGIIGLQYLIWGWWFERIYRSRSSDDVTGTSLPDNER